MRKAFKKLVVIGSVTSALCLGVIPSFAQDSTKTELDFVASVDLYSRYLWRGAQTGTSPSIQPTAKMVYGNFTLGYWGAYQFDGSYPEVDLYASYTLPKGFGVTVTDYFISASDASLSDYLEYNKDRGSAHVLEGVLTYAGPSKFPLSATVGYSFYGVEWNDSTNVACLPGSLYGELGYTIKNFTLIVGGGNKYYAGKKDFAVVNVGAKIVRNIEITDKFTLPVTALIMINPNSKKSMLAVGFTF